MNVPSMRDNQSTERAVAGVHDICSTWGSGRQCERKIRCLPPGVSNISLIAASTRSRSLAGLLLSETRRRTFSISGKVRPPTIPDPWGQGSRGPQGIYALEDWRLPTGQRQRDNPLPRRSTGRTDFSRNEGVFLRLQQPLSPGR